jgi:CspA family cold shock protein
MQGVIKRLVQNNLFGWIEPDDAGRDFFFHKSCVRRGVDFDALWEGQRVQFEEEASAKGPRAMNVRPENL